MASIFSQVPAHERTAENALAFAFRDRFPVSPGHTLVVPKREIATWFEATKDEQLALLELIDVVKAQLDDELAPDGYNVGFNAGEAAGQTVFHLHVHVIPRFRGDMDDPRGGVRHVIPSRGNYRRSVRALSTGGEADPFAAHLWPLIARAERIAVVSAFVQESGLDRLRPAFEAALARGATIRVLTGDYLDITQASALELLLDWMGSEGAPNPDELEAAHSEDTEAGIGRGTLEARIVEVATLPGRSRSFHPKSWRLEGPGIATLFVGSSNLSRAALDTGIEWNLRVDRDRDADAWTRAVEGFDRLWSIARRLDATWIADYAARARAAHATSSRPPVLPPGEFEPDAPLVVPEPHAVQIEALAALAASRAAGRRRGLVVLPTGLGKTWLAAFDLLQLADTLGRRPRVLFVAHRAELLRQAARTFRAVVRARWPEARIGWCVGPSGSLDGDLVFASIQKLARPSWLARLAPDAFDLVVVDEVHHAAAPSYRRLLDRLDPRWTLGLTATPERSDEADLLGLFDDHLAYRSDLGRGIELGRLVPFDYLGLRDDVDYAAIPWRNRRFDPEHLARAVQTERRMEQLWTAWQDTRGTRSLVFCASIAHADFCRDWLRARGLRVDAVHSGEGGDDRDTALERLAAGTLDAICSVDVFNEGVDVPAVDRVVMLRPTESPVVFLQQLGRGLRSDPSGDKARLQVVDFVGNHRIFVDRVRRLLSLAGADDAGALTRLLQADAALELPSGCAVELRLEAKDILSRLLPTQGSEAERVYRSLRDARGERPRAGELFRLGQPPARLRRHGHASWFDFVAAEGDLTSAEAASLEVLRPFLTELETTAMTRCFKPVLVEALIEAEALATGLDLEALAERARRILRRDPELQADVSGPERFEGPGPEAARAFLRYWNDNPVAAWTRSGGKREGRAWFALEGTGASARLVPRFELGPVPEVAVAMVRELVDLRLAEYRGRRRDDRTAALEYGAFEARLGTDGRDPVLELGPGEADARPRGELDVRLPERGTADAESPTHEGLGAAIWRFRLGRDRVTAARPVGTDRNRLPDLLRSWYGPGAGLGGATAALRFVPGPDGWWLERLGEVVALPERGRLRCFPDLRAAAGAATVGDGQAELEADEVVLPVAESGDEVFAVRASGHSMDGGRKPIRDGDWLVMQLCRGAPLSAVEGRVALVQTPDPAFGQRYQVKRVVREGGRFWLRSDHPDVAPIAADADTVPIARLRTLVRPEDLGPSPGTRLDDGALAEAFGGALAERLGRDLPLRSGRHGGHLFFLVDGKTDGGRGAEGPGTSDSRLGGEATASLLAPDRLMSTLRPRPGETAFVLTRRAPREPWRYAGVARPVDTDGTWSVPHLDHASWKALGRGRQSSRTLPEGAEAEARDLVERVLARHPAGTWLEARGQRCRLLGRSDRGGLRIDGGPDGFAPRTVSTTDLAWVLVTRAELPPGTPLDEAAVNRRRYPEGTPKGSTRYIDTGWGLVLVEAV